MKSKSPKILLTILFSFINLQIYLCTTSKKEENINEISKSDEIENSEPNDFNQKYRIYKIIDYYLKNEKQKQSSKFLSQTKKDTSDIMNDDNINKISKKSLYLIDDEGIENIETNYNLNNTKYNIDQRIKSNKNGITKSELLKNKIMAHRGLYGYFPEHSKKGFELAFFMGADFLETDINLTKDGKIVIFHDPNLDDVTNISEFPEFENRKRTKMIDGILYTNKLFISDFTYEEISRLYTRQRFSNRPQIYNNEFKMLLMEDLIKMVIEKNHFHNKTTGIYIEPKNPSFFIEELNLNISEELYKLLKKYNLTDIEDSSNYLKCPIVIQAFEYDTLKFFKASANLPQIYLMTWRFYYNFTEAANVADGFGPDINFILYERVDDYFTANNTYYKEKEMFMEKVVNKKFDDEVHVLENIILPMKNNLFLDYAKKLNMIVHPYNLNNDFPRFSYIPEVQYCKIKKLGADGFFADFCDTALFSIKNAGYLCSDL